MMQADNIKEKVGESNFNNALMKMTRDILESKGVLGTMQSLMKESVGEEFSDVVVGTCRKYDKVVFDSLKEHAAVSSNLARNFVDLKSISNVDLKTDDKHIKKSIANFSQSLDNDEPIHMFNVKVNGKGRRIGVFLVGDCLKHLETLYKAYLDETVAEKDYEDAFLKYLQDVGEIMSKKYFKVDMRDLLRDNLMPIRVYSRYCKCSLLEPTKQMIDDERLRMSVFFENKEKMELLFKVINAKITLRRCINDLEVTKQKSINATQETMKSLTNVRKDNREGIEKVISKQIAHNPYALKAIEHGKTDIFSNKQTPTSQTSTSSTSPPPPQTQSVPDPSQDTTLLGTDSEQSDSESESDHAPSSKKRKHTKFMVIARKKRKTLQT